MDPARRRLLVGGGLFGALCVGGLAPTACALRNLQRGRGVTATAPPRRPPGQARPLLDEDIAPVLARLDRWYAAHLLAGQPYHFNPPASDARIDAVEQLVGFSLPSSYRQLYRWHDGEDDDRWGHFYGLPLLPLERVASEWRGWNEVIKGFGGDRYKIPGASFPAGAVDPAYANPRWIPLTGDGSGNSIGLDFDPWPGGRVGQVILYGRDEDVKLVIADSLGRFLQWIAGLLESGNVRLDAAPGEQLLRRFRLKDPPVDHFHDGLRTLLGAPGPFVR